jgi:probable addiction module antidote protein
LANPETAAAYLSETQKNSPENFLTALKHVAQARKMAAVARESGVQRETLYRSFSEQGNPTWETLTSVLSAVGVGIDFFPLGYEPKPLDITRILVPDTFPASPKPSDEVEELALTGMRGNVPRGFSSLQSTSNNFFDCGALAA